VEPRAGPAATRGPFSCPPAGNTTTKTDLKTHTEHKRHYTPDDPKHLKSLVLTPDAELVSFHRILQTLEADRYGSRHSACELG
jgi:hypothetical protein